MALKQCPRSGCGGQCYRETYTAYDEAHGYVTRNEWTCMQCGRSFGGPVPEPIPDPVPGRRRREPHRYTKHSKTAAL